MNKMDKLDKMMYKLGLDFNLKKQVRPNMKIQETSDVVKRKNKRKPKKSTGASPPATTYESNWDEVIPAFEEMGLNNDLLRGIYARNMRIPSAIQQRVIKPCLLGHNVIMQAQLGTGKTATLTIAALSKVKKDIPEVQVLVLAPIRELALQLIREIKLLAIHMPWISCYSSIGRMSRVTNDMKELTSGKHQILVGTPGRIQNLIYAFDRWKKKDGIVSPFESVALIVVDEADEMLIKPRRQALKIQVKDILHSVGKVATQKILTSATMPPDIIKLTSEYMGENPIFILVKNNELTLEGVQQFYVDVYDSQYKLDTLCDIYAKLPIVQAIIFCNSRTAVEHLTTIMREKGHRVSAMHGRIEQAERSQMFNEFRTGRTRVLITTDLCGRGIDIEQVSHIINFDLPPNKVIYRHRVGRCGRYGRTGMAISLITAKEPYTVQELSDFYKTQIDKLPMNAPKLGALIWEKLLSITQMAKKY